ncbi:MAG: imidazole glycerol phosphate synthase subunit HisF [Flavobacteriaceae bacterium]|nr:MAG: imidazole glycerol phosphate synthase subunit HisF [Flavobacteriaceae bacterium]
MLTKRIIPCLDIKDGRTVKGVNFVDLKDAGDPIELAQFYSENGADELVFLDITATHQKRKTLVEMVKNIAKEISIPFTVGGGISSLEIAEELILNGADKVSINSAAVKDPSLIGQISETFGSQAVVLAVDAKKVDGKWWVHLNGGRIKTDLDLFDWTKKAQDLGAGEILFTSMDHDGTKDGFAIEALSKMQEELSIPIIASGGAGKTEDFLDVFANAHVDAALAASVFHFKEIEINALKMYLKNHGICMRI